ncbi:MAG: hypothetical protein KJ645_02745 [Planctomycetes bacterium]|nr:hypothetical protein [Planctomycetota bacterium]
MTVVLVTCFLATYAEAQWEHAALEQITSGPDYDMLGRNALVIDEHGTLHLVFSRGMAISHLFYVSKSPYGDWSDPEPIGDHELNHGFPVWIELGPNADEQYVLFSQDCVLTLGIRHQGSWDYYPLETPYDWPFDNPVLAVDVNGDAHVAMIFHNPTGSMHHIGYGYWDRDNPTEFQVQIFDEFTAIEDAGLWGQPVITTKPDGSAILGYRSLYQWATVELIVARNSSAGGTDWVEEVVGLNGIHCFTGYFDQTPGGDLHFTFVTNMFWPFPKEVYYIMQPAGSSEWTAPVKISGEYYGIFPKLVVDDLGKAHVVCQETSGMQSTGNLLYFTNESGSWTQEYLIEGLWGNPSFVMDRNGNGNVVVTDEVDHIDDYDIYYYGHVANPHPKRKFARYPQAPAVQKQ